MVSKKLSPRAKVYIAGGVLVTAATAVGIWYILNDRTEEPKPSPEDWENRLVEHIDVIFLPDAIARYRYFVQIGIEPQHAFEMVISV